MPNLNSQINKWLPTFGACLAGTRSSERLRDDSFHLAVFFVAILQMCLARTRTYKRFRDKSFHLTGFAGKSTLTTNLAIVMPKMKLNLSLTLSLSLAKLSCEHVPNSRIRRTRTRKISHGHKLET